MSGNRKWRKIMKKTIIGSIVMLLLFILIAPVYPGSSSQRTGGAAASGAYQRDPNLNPPGVFPINKQTVTLKMGVQQNGQIPEWETNYQTRMIERLGNYKLVFEVYPAGELMQKLDLMINAGGSDLPDVLISGSAFNLGRLTKYGQAGMVIPCNQYYENSAHFINIAKQGVPFDPLMYTTSYDGNVYGMYYVSTGYDSAISMSRIMIYEPWLRKLGLSRPETTDEFVNVLRAFRDQDPNGNGIKDEIPLMCYRNAMSTNVLYALMMPFIYTQPNYWMHNNGKIDVAFNKPGWREGLRYIKQLIDEGLFSPLSFTQDENQMTGVMSPNPAKVGAMIRSSTSNLGINDPKRAEYIVMGPLEGPAGKQKLYWPQIPFVSLIITKNCKTPESAFMLGDLMCEDEMSITSRHGEKGVDWFIPQPPDNKSMMEGRIMQYREIQNIWGTPSNKHWAVNGPRITPLKYAFFAAENADPTNPADFYVEIARYILTEMQYTTKDPITGLVYNEREQAIMDEFHSTIISYVQESYARFVTGDLSIDRDWDRYVGEFGRMSLSNVIGAAQSAWDRQQNDWSNLVK